MNCPTDEEWAEHLEGPPRPRLSKHLEACATCKATLDAARAAANALANLSPGGRRLCPPPEELTAVPAGVAPAAVRLHVALCTDCQDDLADLAALETEPPREIVARWLADGFRIVSQTLDGLAQPVLVPATRGATAGTTSWRLTQPLDEGELALELASGDHGTFALSVTIPPPVKPGTRVDLESEARLLESRALDASGRYAFLGLDSGVYTLTLRRSGSPPVRISLDVTP